MTAPIVLIFEVWEGDEKVGEVGCADDQLSTIMEQEYPGRQWTRDDDRIDLVEGEQHEIATDIDDRSIKEFATKIRRLQNNRRKTEVEKLAELQNQLRTCCAQLATYERDLDHIQSIEVKPVHDLVGAIHAVEELDGVSDVDSDSDYDLIVSLPHHKVRINLVNNAISVTNGNGEITLPTKIAKVIPKYLADFNLANLVQLIGRYFNGRPGQAEQN